MPLSRQFEERVAGGHTIQLMDSKVARVSRPLEYPFPALVLFGLAQDLDDVGSVRRQRGEQRSFVFASPEVTLQDQTVTQ